MTEPSTGRASGRRSCTRAETAFQWYVSGGMPLYAKLAGVRFDRIFREREAIVQAYTEGLPRARELYGPDLNCGGPGWAEMVYPFQERFFVRQTSGQRHAHIENLVPAHLPFLDQLALDSFDPSVSTKLTPRDLRDGCSVPFLWRLNAMQVRDFSHAQIRRFVFEAVADGASGVFCAVAAIMADAESAAKVYTFIDAVRQVETLLADRCPRQNLAGYI